jgi:ubiquitin C-terminal hydrolase
MDEIIDINSLVVNVYQKNKKLDYFPTLEEETPGKGPENFTLLSICESPYLIRYVPKFYPLNYRDSYTREIINLVSIEFLTEYSSLTKTWFSEKSIDTTDKTVYTVFDKIMTEIKRNKYKFLLVPITENEKILCYIFVDNLRKEYMFWSLNQYTWFKTYSELEKRINIILNSYPIFKTFTMLNVKQQDNYLIKNQEDIINDFFYYFPNTRYLYTPKERGTIKLDYGLLFVMRLFFFILRMDEDITSSTINMLYTNLFSRKDIKKTLYIHFFFFVHYIIRRIFRNMYDNDNELEQLDIKQGIKYFSVIFKPHSSLDAISVFKEKFYGDVTAEEYEKEMKFYIDEYYKTFVKYSWTWNKIYEEKRNLLHILYTEDGKKKYPMSDLYNQVKLEKENAVLYSLDVIRKKYLEYQNLYKEIRSDLYKLFMYFFDGKNTDILIIANRGKKSEEFENYTPSSCMDAIDKILDISRWEREKEIEEVRKEEWKPAFSEYREDKRREDAPVFVPKVELLPEIPYVPLPAEFFEKSKFPEPLPQKEPNLPRPQKQLPQPIPPQPIPPRVQPQKEPEIPNVPETQQPVQQETQIQPQKEPKIPNVPETQQPPQVQQPQPEMLLQPYAQKIKYQAPEQPQVTTNGDGGSSYQYTLPVFNVVKTTIPEPKSEGVQRTETTLPKSKEVVVPKIHIPYQSQIIQPKESPKGKISFQCGLQNVGNTCYMNSIIQSIRVIPIIDKIYCDDDIFSKIDELNIDLAGKDLLKIVSNMFKDMKMNTTYNPNDFYNMILKIYPKFTERGSQADSEELLLLIYDEVFNSLFKNIITLLLTTTILDPYTWNERILSINSINNKKGIEFNPLDYIKIPKLDDIYINWSTIGADIVQIHEGDQWTTKNTSIKITSSPQVLIISHKKFTRDGNKVITSKCNMKLDESIDIKRNVPEDFKEETKYTLCSCVVWDGHLSISGSGGHYYAYGRDFINNQWILFNDNYTKPVNFSEVQNHKNNICLLFYVRNDWDKFNLITPFKDKRVTNAYSRNTIVQPVLKNKEEISAKISDYNSDKPKENRIEFLWALKYNIKSKLTNQTNDLPSFIDKIALFYFYDTIHNYIFQSLSEARMKMILDLCKFSSEGVVDYENFIDYYLSHKEISQTENANIEDAINRHSNNTTLLVEFKGENAPALIIKRNEFYIIKLSPVYSFTLSDNSILSVDNTNGGPIIYKEYYTSYGDIEYILRLNNIKEEDIVKIYKRKPAYLDVIDRENICVNITPRENLLRKDEKRYFFYIEWFVNLLNSFIRENSKVMLKSEDIEWKNFILNQRAIQNIKSYDISRDSFILSNQELDNEQIATLSSNCSEDNIDMYGFFKYLL